MATLSKREIHRCGVELINLVSVKGKQVFEDTCLPQFIRLVESIPSEAWGDLEHRYEALHLAAQRGRIQAVELLLDPLRKPYVNHRRVDGSTALHQAALNGHVAVVRRLLDCNAMVSLLAYDTGNSVLHYALSRPIFQSTISQNARKRTVQALLDKGADPNVYNHAGLSPVHYAALYGHTKSLALILARSGPPSRVASSRDPRNHKNLEGNTPLHLAASRGHVEEVKLLLGEHAVNINDGNVRKELPLFLAANHDYGRDVTEWSNHDETVRLLLDRDASTTQKMSNGVTMLDWATSEGGRSSAADIILRKEFGTWPSSRAQESGTPGPNWNYLDPADGSSVVSAMWFFARYRGDPIVDHAELVQPSVRTLACGTNNVTGVYNQLDGRSGQGFAWFHVPDNNMEWVVDLHRQICRDEESRESDAAQVDSRSFGAFIDTSRQLLPQLRQDIHYGPNRSIKTVFLSIPYLCVETNQKRVVFESRIESSKEQNIGNNDHLSRAISSTQGSQAHRKTLDQYCYNHLHDTGQRDISQVMLRASNAGQINSDLAAELLEGSSYDCPRAQWWPDVTESPSPTEKIDGQVLMVDQACIWILGDDTVITSFPSSWQEESSKWDALTRILSYVDTTDRAPMTSVFELSAFIIRSCVTMRTESWLQSFNLMVDLTADLQVRHFKDFVSCMRITEKAKSEKGKCNNLEDAEDKLTSIFKEVKNLCEVNDIRDELHIIEQIFREQRQVVDQLVDMEYGQKKTWKHTRTREEQKKLVDQLDQGLTDVKKLLETTERTHSAILQLLDLKQQQASVSEARTARKQSEDTARQNDTVQLFTFVTIIFAPASFLVAFFAIPDLKLPGLDTSSIGGAVGAIIVFSTVIWVPIILYVLFSDHVSNWIRRYRLANGSGRSATAKLGGSLGPNRTGSSNAGLAIDKATMEMRTRRGLRVQRSDLEKGIHVGVTGLRR